VTGASFAVLGFAAAGQLLRDLHEHLADAMIGGDSAIIWPLLAAVPKIRGSHGIDAIG